MTLCSVWTGGQSAAVCLCQETRPASPGVRREEFPPFFVFIFFIVFSHPSQPSFHLSLSLCFVSLLAVFRRARRRNPKYNYCPQLNGGGGGGPLGSLESGNGQEGWTEEGAVNP